MKLLTLLLLLGVVSPAVSKVVKSFSECPVFFVPNPEHKDQPITSVLKGDQYQLICQIYKEELRFATLYDTHHRIPVYSAYTLTSKDNGGSGERCAWKIEPQLDGLKGDEMRASESLNQAMDVDYKLESKECDYTRGHLFPKGFTVNKDEAQSTCTLTNAAPQLQNNNKNWGKQVEKLILELVRKNCLDQKAHVVTGVIPGEQWLPIKREKGVIEHGVNIPRFFWSAYFCISKNKEVMARAYITEQEPCKPTEKIPFNPKMMTIADLNKILSKSYNQDVIIFPEI